MLLSQRIGPLPPFESWALLHDLRFTLFFAERKPKTKKDMIDGCGKAALSH